jgi:hypothetical protein
MLKAAINVPGHGPWIKVTEALMPSAVAGPVLPLLTPLQWRLSNLLPKKPSTGIGVVPVDP